MIKTLEKEFIGIGEVKEFLFMQKNESEKCFIYQVEACGTIHFEVFRKKLVALCIDFDNKIYSEEDFKEQYPKSNDFGIWAWTKQNYRDALHLFEKINSEQRKA